MTFKKKGILLLFLFLHPDFISHCISQTNKEGTFLVEGLVYGYRYDPAKKILQKEKQIVLEGTLDKASVSVSESGKILSSSKTNKKGEFQLKLPFGKIYQIEISKQGYEKSILLVDIRSITKKNVGNEMKFIGMELILNSFKSNDTSQIIFPFGKLFYNEKARAMNFEPNLGKIKKGLFAKQEGESTPVVLMRRAVLKNRNNSLNEPKDAKKDILKNIKKDTKENTFSADTVTAVNTTTSSQASKFKLSRSQGYEYFADHYIKIRELEIKEAQQELEKDRLNATSKEDSLEVMERETQLNSAIAELTSAKKIIELQKNQISTQRILLILSICFMLLLSAFSFMIFKHNREKRRIHLLLKAKTKKITDSINYAKRIQKSILLEENEIQKMLPQSFIYYQPRDIVSGDFYWCSKLEDKIIVAAIDCTGHGVPGAFMSLIGNALLNEIINEKLVVQPGKILEMLHAGVLKSLNQNAGETQSQDGMEISLCVIDHEKKLIEFAGAMNPVYIVENNNVVIVEPNIRSIGGTSLGNTESTRSEFTTHQIPIHENMGLYLFSDGYMDQFGGPENKKFNTSAFRKLLLDIQSMSMAEQKLAMEETMQNWKGDYKQIDDMLVIGIRF